MLEETLDEVTVTGSAYTTCDQCHGDVLRTELEIHKEQLCPERPITCSVCSVTYKEYQGHNCNGSKCVFCNQPVYLCICSNSIVPDCGGSGSGGNGCVGGSTSTTYDNVEGKSDDNVTRTYSAEEELNFAKALSNKIRDLLDELEKNGKLKIVKNYGGRILKNPKYEKNTDAVYLPKDFDFTPAAVSHELIHRAQNKLGMMISNKNDSNIEYQTYVLNFILQSACACGSTRGIDVPQGVKNTRTWNDFIDFIGEKNHCGKENGELWIDQALLDNLNTLDHKSLSQAFMTYYSTSMPKQIAYYKYYDANYKYNWANLLSEMGIIVK